MTPVPNSPPSTSLLVLVSFTGRYQGGKGEWDREETAQRFRLHGPALSSSFFL